MKLLAGSTSNGPFEKLESIYFGLGSNALLFLVNVYSFMQWWNYLLIIDVWSLNTSYLFFEYLLILNQPHTVKAD